ncbi:MAG: response regulator [Planctomycetia bacterium]|nr:response regulator [Planctomycetia bacterium]
MHPRILICDDEPDIVLALGMKFRNAGFEVRTARHGQEAWELILADPPDALITDWTMPRMDGLALCRRIRSIPALEQLPIFLLTGRGLEIESYAALEELEISRLIHKPFSPRDLFHDVQTALGIMPAGA